MAVVHIRKDAWRVAPHESRLLAAKVIDNIHTSTAAMMNAAPRDDEGQLLLAQALLLARARVFVGTLTSNYALMVHDLMKAHWLGAAVQPDLVDLDGNDYYSCSVKENPPWGAMYGRAGYMKIDAERAREAQEQLRRIEENKERQAKTQQTREETQKKANERGREYREYLKGKAKREGTG
mmetsp:Transcript_12826/g.33101  ORF Transcript_12826/g.33101 Transcript_12826/m.33101 type:complete len:180 (-) Transcript_12826:108-647(-)